MRSSSRIIRSPQVSEDSFLIEHDPLPVPGSSPLFSGDYDTRSILELEDAKLLTEEEAVDEGSEQESEGTTAVPGPTAQELAQAEAVEILRQAQEQAAALVAEAQASREQVLAAAHQEGYQAGYAAGSADGVKAGRELATVLRDVSERLVREEQRMVKAVESRLARLALEIARKVIREEMKIGDHSVRELVRLALLPFQEEEHVVVRLNPHDLSILKKFNDDVVLLFDSSGHLRIVEDRRVSRGGCIIESPSGRLDARHEAQLDRVADLIEEEASYGAHQSGHQALPVVDGEPEGDGEADE